MLQDLSIKEFLSKTAGNDPVPGGGSVSALNASLASALTEMVANLTIGKKKYEEKEELMLAIAETAAACRNRFIAYIDEDSEAYNKVFAAFKLPKETDEEKAERSRQIQEATKYAADVPMQVARKTHQLLDTIARVAREGNSNAVTDACVAMMAARTAILGALLNVKINLSSIKDAAFVETYTNEANRIEQETVAKETELLNWIRELL